MADILDLEEGEVIGMDEGDDVDTGGSGIKEAVGIRKGRGIGGGTSRREQPSTSLETRHYAIEKERSKILPQQYEAVEAGRAVEGWILIITGVHEEAQEDDLQERFAEFGDIKNLHMNLDRRTGFNKGYALIEYDTLKEAQAAKDAMDGIEVLGNVISVDFAFLKRPISAFSRLRKN